MPRYNNYRNRNQMTLNTAGFQPVVFNPIEYTPVEADYNILTKAMGIQEARQKEAVERRTAIDAALGDVEKNLYNTPEMNEWWSNYKQDINDRINAAAQVVDFSSAINIATQEAGRISSDSALIGRLEASKNYKAWTDELHKKREAGDITKDTEEYYLKQTPFKYEDAFDASGNAVKGNTYEDLNTPVNDIKLDEFIVKAFKYITPSKPGSGNFKTVNKDGTSSQKTLEYVNEDDIIRNLNEIFNLQDDARAALWQRYQVQKDKYEELKRYCIEHPEDTDAKLRLRQQKETLSKGQGTVDFEHFVARTLGKTAISNNLAYRYVSTSNDLESTADRAKAGRKGELDAEHEYDFDAPETPGGRTPAGSTPGSVGDA